MTKSHVSMEQAVCVVCCRQYDTGAILLDRRLRQSMESHTVTHVGGFCKTCNKLKEEGYVAIIGAKDPPDDGDRIQPEEADRTGDVIHVRARVWGHLFNTPVPEEGLSFAPPEVMAHLKKIVPPEEGV